MVIQYIRVLSSSWDGRPFGHNRHGPKIGGLFPLGRGGGSPSNTMWPGPRPTSLPWHLDPAIWPQRAWAENWRAVPLWGGELGPYLTQCGLGWAYLCTKLHLDPSSRLTTTDMTEFFLVGGGLCPFGGGELGSHLTQFGKGWDLPQCQVSSWSIQPFGYNRHGPRIMRTLAPVNLECGGLLCPFPWGQLNPHLTQCGQGRGLHA